MFNRFIIPSFKPSVNDPAAKNQNFVIVGVSDSQVSTTSDIFDRFSKIRVRAQNW